MSEYSTFADTEALCPACGAELDPAKDKLPDGWQCPKCKDFIPEGVVLNPYKGLSNKHKQNSSWR